jgi:hypothetical protein
VSCPKVIKVVTPGPPGPPGGGTTLTGPAVLGRETGTGAPTALPLGPGLSIVAGALTSTGVTDLGYDAATRTLTSSTGADVVLPLATTAAAGLMSATDKAHVGVAWTVTATVHNRSGAEIPKGRVCYIDGSSGTRPTVQLANASSEVTAARTRGLALAAIPNNADGQLVVMGPLDGLNTSALTEGAVIWLDTTDGGITTTRPAAPAHGVSLGVCVRSGPGTSGSLWIQVLNGQELEELHDVLITGTPPTAPGDPRPVLAWEADGLWHDVQLTPDDCGAEPAGAAAAAIAGHEGQATPHGFSAVGMALGQALTKALQRAHLELGSAATTDAGAYATAAQGTDSREWTAATVDQAEAEAGTATTRRAWTAQRVRQAAAAWWLTASSAAGRALASAADAAAQWTLLKTSAISPSAAQPLAGTAAAGTTGLAADAGHVHQFPPEELPLWLSGPNADAAVGTGVARFVFRRPAQILSWELLGTAPSTSAFVIDAKKNGVTIWSSTGTRPTIGVGNTTSASGAGSVAGTLATTPTTFAVGDVLTVDNVQAAGGARTAYLSLLIQFTG